MQVHIHGAVQGRHAGVCKCLPLQTQAFASTAWRLQLSVLAALLSGGWYVYQQRNEVHNNCGIEIYYQTDMQATHENMLLELFCQIIVEPCFNTLRTKEQLGQSCRLLRQHVCCYGRAE